MIGEDLQKFSGSRVMRTSAIGRVPIRNLPKRISFTCINYKRTQTKKNWGRFNLLRL